MQPMRYYAIQVARLKGERRISLTEEQGFRSAISLKHLDTVTNSVSTRPTHYAIVLAHVIYPLTTTAAKHPVRDRVEPSFVIFDIRALSVRVPVLGCQKLQMTA